MVKLGEMLRDQVAALGVPNSKRGQDTLWALVALLRGPAVAAVVYSKADAVCA